MKTATRLITLAVVVAAMAGAASPAFAARPRPTVELTPAGGPGGSQVRLEGRDLPRGRARISSHRRVLATVRVGASGAFTRQVKVKGHAGPHQIVTATHDVAIVNHFVVGGAAAGGEVADSHGSRVTLAAGRISAGDSLSIKAAGLAADAAGSVSVPGTSAAGSFQTDARGRATVNLELSVTDPPGPATVVLELRRTKLTLHFRILEPRDVLIGAAGDIACDPEDPLNGAGDPNRCQQMATSQLLLDADVDAALPLGDTQYEEGALASYLGSYDPSWGRLKDRTYPAIGNHEYLTPDAAGYFDYFNGAGNATGPAGNRDEGYYSYDLGAWHLIAINSQCSAASCAVGDEQEAWLRADLAKSDANCVLAYFHHPYFSDGQHGDTTSTRPLIEDLYAAGADVILSGHDHVYERFGPQDPDGAPDPAGGIRQFVVGTGGRNHTAFPAGFDAESEAHNADSFGALLMTLKPSSYSWEFRPIPGDTFVDSGTANCH